MFEIKMTIEIPGLPEALNALAGAIGKQPEFVCHQHGGTTTTSTTQALSTLISLPLPLPTP